MPPVDAAPLWFLTAVQTGGHAGQGLPLQPGRALAIEACCPKEGLCHDGCFSARLKQRENLGRKLLKDLSKTQGNRTETQRKPKETWFWNHKPWRPGKPWKLLLLRY
jgi:hypothetical protein